MNEHKYSNAIRRQIFDLPKIADVQVENCFRHEQKKLMSIAEIFDMRKIIVTGCGDSYAAAIAMAPVLERYADCFGVKPMRAIDFTRFLTKEEIGIGEPNSPLVIGISAGGETARIAEAMQKAEAVGAFSVLITNNPESRAAKAAKRVLALDMPAYVGHGPGLCSYFASLTGLIALAMRLGHVRGTLPPTANADFQKAIRDYMVQVTSKLEEYDAAMLELAEKWSCFTNFDFIGDDAEFGSAFFGAAKFVECAGSTVSVDDSEDWCHINFFLKNPESIGTVILADKNSPAYGREKETAASAARIGRPVLVVTNGKREDFPDNSDVCIIPEAPSGYEWLLPIADFIPAALLAGYVAVLQNEPFFRRATPEIRETDPMKDIDFGDHSMNTINSSQIKIFD